MSGMFHHLMLSFPVSKRVLRENIPAIPQPSTLQANAHFQSANPLHLCNSLLLVPVYSFYRWPHPFSFSVRLCPRVATYTCRHAKQKTDSSTSLFFRASLIHGLQLTNLHRTQTHMKLQKKSRSHPSIPQNYFPHLQTSVETSNSRRPLSLNQLLSIYYQSLSVALNCLNISGSMTYLT